MLVVNEPGVAEAINRLRGEWAERSGGELSATSKSWAEVDTAKNLDADAIIFPSRYLGGLCVRGWLRPVRPSVLESEEFNAADVFPLVRRELCKWGGEVMALPLGVDLSAKPGDGHPGIALFAEMAPAALSNGREVLLFDTQTMKPRLSDPTFVAALQRLVESNGKNVASGTDGAHYAPVFGYGDRLVAVGGASRNGASAFRLIAWLASAETSSQLAKAGERMMPVRRALVSSSAWYDPALDAQERSKFGKALEATLSGEKCLLIPRIPGVDEYMAALDDAVKAATVGKVAPQAALEKAAANWEQITDAHGRDSQRRAYLKHLGISGP